MSMTAAVSSTTAVFPPELEARIADIERDEAIPGVTRRMVRQQLEAGYPPFCADPTLALRTIGL